MIKKNKHLIHVDSPVRDLNQVHSLVSVQQLGDVVTDDSNEEGDEDDGQDHPHPDAGVQQELWTDHGPGGSGGPGLRL